MSSETNRFCRARKGAVLAALAIGVLVAPFSEGATRLLYEIGGSPRTISWNELAFPIELVVDREIGISAGAIVRRATEVWSTGSEDVLSFRIGEGSGLRAGQDGQNVVILNDGLLSQNGVLAFTTTWFDDDGRIIESDIQIDRSQVSNLGALLTHELGHSLGFDHSAHLSSAMYPYVPEGGRLDLELDDRLALKATYPGNHSGGSIAGTVRGQDGPRWGVQVVALDEHGQPVESTLSDEKGEFRLTSLPEGTYELYAEPLDGPVGPNNFSGVWRGIPSRSFPTEFLGNDEGALRVSNGSVREGVVLTISSAPMTLNPKWIGRIDPAAGELVLDSIPVDVNPGETVGLAVGGDGFVPGMTRIEVSGDGIRRVSEFQYGANYVWAEYEIQPDAIPRSAVVIVDTGSERATLTGGLRIGEDGGRRKTIRRR